MPFDHLPATTYTDVRHIPALLATLRQTAPPEGGVLSAYLATPLPAMAGRAYLVSFREGCKTLRTSLPPEALRRFEATVARADRQLAGSFVPGQPGLALFAAEQPEYFCAVPLPRPPEEFTRGPRPALVPLEILLDDCERIALST